MSELGMIAVLGGAGKEGGGLALRWAHAGHRVIIGSRSPDRAIEAAIAINTRVGAARVQGADNASAAQMADIVVLAVPYAAQQETALSVAMHLQGKVLIDVTAPLKPPKVSVVQLPPEGSACLALQNALGDGVRVVAAFQNISAHHLNDLDHAMDCDVLVAANDPAAAETAIALAEAAGMRGWHVGVLANAAAAEALTSVLIAINRRYKIDGAGIRITGSPTGA